MQWSAVACVALVCTKSVLLCSVSGVGVKGEVNVAVLHVAVLHTDSASSSCDVCAAGMQGVCRQWQAGVWHVGVVRVMSWVAALHLLCPGVSCLLGAVGVGVAVSLISSSKSNPLLRVSCCHMYTPPGMQGCAC